MSSGSLADLENSSLLFGYYPAWMQEEDEQQGNRNGAECKPGCGRKGQIPSKEEDRIRKRRVSRPIFTRFIIFVRSLSMLDLGPIPEEFSHL